MKNLITIEALELIQIINKKGSLAEAAKVLHKVPSAISYSIRKLEQDLGVVLFKKEGRRVILTPAGKILLEQGSDIIEAVIQLEKKVIETSSGWEPRLNIAIDSILSLEFIYPYLKKFYKLHPDIEINLYEEVLNGAWEAAIQGRADLVIGASNKPVIKKELSFKFFKTTKWVFCVSPKHPLAHANTPLSMKEIEHHRFVIVKDSVRDWPACSTRIFTKLPVLRVPTIQDKMIALSDGLGVGFLPEDKANQLKKSGKIITLLTEYQEEETDLYMVWKTSNKGRALKWFLSNII